MNIKVFIDKEKEEEVLVFAHERNALVNEIERIVQENNLKLVGYKENEASKLKLFDVNCFISENNKVFALTNEKMQLKLRLYQIEEMLDDNFVKINQSCIANIRQIEKVQATFSGSFQVVFRNGYRFAFS